MNSNNISEEIHKTICGKNIKICEWFCERSENLSFPIYSSYDIRDSGFKVSNVDANIFPAGFNNICPTDKESSVAIMETYLRKHYGSELHRILLVTEEHTANPFYWENVLTISGLLKSVGKKVLIGIPRKLEVPLVVQSATGVSVEVVSAFENSKEVKEFAPQLVVSNNDFSIANEEWAAELTLPMNPPRELGWYQRKKSRYFKHYNQLVQEFSDLLGFDPFLINIKTEVFENFELTDDSSRQHLSEQVDKMISEIQKDYDRKGITEKPFVFVKNNSGTYGLAVVRVGSGAEVKEWTYKSRKKMKAAKGGRDVEEVIIQEGIPSIVRAEGASAEPVIYMIGCDLAGGFLRTHAEKSATESLNSPGAVFKKLCVSDLNVSLQGSPLENVYGWSAKLGVLAIALEAQEMGVVFKSYQQIPCPEK